MINIEQIAVFLNFLPEISKRKQSFQVFKNHITFAGLKKGVFAKVTEESSHNANVRFSPKTTKQDHRPTNIPLKELDQFVHRLHFSVKNPNTSCTVPTHRS